MNPKEKSRAANPATTQDDNLYEDYTTETGLMQGFSVFRNSFDTEPAGETTLAELAADIQGGKWQAQVEKLREMTPELYSQNKRHLPAVAFGGIFTRRKKNALVTPSRYVVIDIDHVTGQELTDIKAVLTADRHTALCFVSPSGEGLKAVFVADFSDDDSFKQAYKAISRYLLASYGLKIDETGKDVCRLCYVSYDPAVYLNQDAAKFIYEVAADSEPEPRPMEKPTTAFFTGNQQQKYVLSVINGEIESVESAPRGGGNSALNIAAMKIGQFFYLGLFDKEAIKQHLTAAYLRRGGSFKNQAEADATFESGWLTGVNSPRTLPERGRP